MKKLWNKIVTNSHKLNKRALILQILAGGYLAYLGWGLFADLAETPNPVLFGAISVLFMLLGAFLVIRGLLEYTRQHYLELAELSLPGDDPNSPPITLKPMEEKMIRLFGIDLAAMAAEQQAELSAEEEEEE